MRKAILELFSVKAGPATAPKSISYPQLSTTMLSSSMTLTSECFCSLRNLKQVFSFSNSSRLDRSRVSAIIFFTFSFISLKVTLAVSNSLSVISLDCLYSFLMLNSVRQGFYSRGRFFDFSISSIMVCSSLYSLDVHFDSSGTSPKWIVLSQWICFLSIAMESIILLSSSLISLWMVSLNLDQFSRTLLIIYSESFINFIDSVSPIQQRIFCSSLFCFPSIFSTRSTIWLLPISSSLIFGPSDIFLIFPWRGFHNGQKVLKSLIIISSTSKYYILFSFVLVEPKHSQLFSLHQQLLHQVFHFQELVLQLLVPHFLLQILIMLPLKTLHRLHLFLLLFFQPSKHDHQVLSF